MAKKRKTLKKSEWILLVPIEHIIGREYYCIWQKNTYTKFILKEITGDTVIMYTKDNSRTFKTNLVDLRDTHKNMKNEQFREEMKKRAVKRLQKIQEKELISEYKEQENHP